MDDVWTNFDLYPTSKDDTACIVVSTPTITLQLQSIYNAGHILRKYVHEKNENRHPQHPSHDSTYLEREGSTRQKKNQRDCGLPPTYIYSIIKSQKILLCVGLLYWIMQQKQQQLPNNHKITSRKRLDDFEHTWPHLSSSSTTALKCHYYWSAEYQFSKEILIH